LPYTLLYHPDVADADLPLLPSNIQRRIARAIETRLAEAPERYGAPLRETLRGYWKLRVGDYRVVYQVAGSEVRVLGICIASAYTTTSCGAVGGLPPRPDPFT